MMGLDQKEPLGEDRKKMERSCSDCRTTKTPLWRGGPAGPKSLCNACGIRYRKRRSSESGLSKGGAEKKREKSSSPSSDSASDAAATSDDGGLSESLKMGLMALGEEVWLQQRSSPSSCFSSPVKRQRSRRKLREEEEAAVLLMSLSCGSVFA